MGRGSNKDITLHNRGLRNKTSSNQSIDNQSSTTTPTKSTSARDEWAADGAILDIDFAPEINCFVTASADGQAYLRRFGDEKTNIAATYTTSSNFNRGSANLVRRDGHDNSLSNSGVPIVLSLLAVMQGHESDVTAVKWVAKRRQWVTGSEDRTIRIWVSYSKYLLLIYILIVSASRRNPLFACNLQ